nr:putative ribonuclease H-like domain-containing protein [Tanacetum cinerariifolium]
MTNYSLWERLARKNELKARGTLLMALPDKHQLKFNTHKDAKTLMEAIKKKRNKTDLEKQSLDDLFNNLKIYEAEVKSASSASTSTQNINFVSSSNTDSTNEPISAAASVSAIDADDLEEMDLKWKMAMLTVRARKGHFVRECRSPKDTRRNGAAEPQRRNVSVETSISNALVSQCDGVGSYDWSFQADKEPTNYALMAFTSSSSSSNNEVVSCSKACTKAYAKLQSHYDKLTDDYRKSQFDIISYKTGLESLEARLLVYKQNESIFEKDIKLPNLEVQLRDNALVVLRQKLETAEQERDDLKLKLSPTKPDKDLSPTHRPLAPIIEDLVSDSEDDSEAKILQNNPSFVQPTDQVKTHRPSVQPVEISIPAANPKTAIPKPKSKGNSRNRKACFVCKSLTHLINDCDYNEKKMAQITARTSQTYCHQRHVAHTAILTQSRLVPIKTVRPVTTVVPKTNVTRPRQAKPIVTKPYSPPRRHINRSPSPKSNTFPLKVTTVKAPMVNAVNSVHGKWEWKPKCPILDHGNPQYALQDKRVIDSRCSRHMTGNMSYLSDFEELNGGSVAFGGNPKSGKISGKDAAFDEKEPEFKGRKPESEVNVSPSSKFEDFSDNSINEVNATGNLVAAVGQIFTDSTNTFSAAELEDITYSDDEEDVGAEADFNNLKTTITEEGIDYEEVFTLVVRIEAIRLFLAYASFMGFMVYQMDVKSAFLYGTIEEEVYVCQPLGFKDPGYPDKVYKVVKALYGLHQAPRACTPIDTEKPLLKDLDGEDVDVHTYKSMIGSLIYLTSSRPDIMFAKVNDVMRLQALVDKKKVVINKDTIRDALRLADAEGVDCLPNEEIFTKLARMGSSMAFAVICLSTGMIVEQPVGEGAPKVDVEDVSVVGVAKGAASVTDDVVPTAGRIIADMDANVDVTLKDIAKDVALDPDIKESVDIQGRQAESQAQIYQTDLEHDDKVLSMQDDEVEPAELQEVVEVVTTTKLITKVVTAASATIIAAAPQLTNATALTLTTAPSTARRRKGVVIRDLEETATPSTIIHSEAKSKDKGKGILVEEPKPIKNQAQIKQDEAYARELEAELNKNIDWDEVIDHVHRKQKEDNAVKSLLGFLIQEKMSRDVIAVGLTMRILLLYQGEYSQCHERFMNYLEEQMDGEAMINYIHNGDQPLPVIAQVSLAGTTQNGPLTLKDLKFWTAEEKKTRKIDHLARSLLIQGLPNDIYSLIDSNKTAKDLWDALERQMRGSEYGEQDRKATILYEYETFKATEGEHLLDTYLRYLQMINDLKKCGYKKDNCEINYKFLNNLQPEWKQYSILMRQTKNLIDINIDSLYNILKQNQSDNEKKKDKKADDKKRDMSKVKCYNCKNKGHFAKDCKKAKVKDYNYYKTKMLLAKKDSDEQVLLAKDQAWMDSQ